VLLVSVSIPNPPDGTTFRFGSYAGLTPSYGFDFTGEKTTLNFTGTQADINAALATMLVSTGSVQGAFDFDVTSSLNVSNTYYNPINNSYYQYVASRNITWTNALAQAATKTLNGATGYLVTITTDSENQFIMFYVNASDIWIGASDAGNEGVWTWRNGPEAGTQFWQGGTPAQGGYATEPYYYAAWAPNQPDNAGRAEHYGSTNFRGTLGAWNDLPLNGANLISGYLVEYTEPAGGWTGVTQTRTAAYVGNAQGGVGGAGGDAGKGGNGAAGGSVGGADSAGGDGGTGGVGGSGGPGVVANGGTGGVGGTGGDGGDGGTGNPGTTGSAGSPGTVATGFEGGAGGAGGTAGTGGAV
ncbi:MAG: hypothetical protein KDB47_17800, partial [Mycobacterium sp.]|nr:hypothetical protein [Mycobacterium sp.]